jgi:hypothetical protein
MQKHVPRHSERGESWIQIKNTQMECGKSKGTRAEIAIAESFGLPIVYVNKYM